MTFLSPRVVMLVVFLVTSAATGLAQQLTPQDLVALPMEDLLKIKVTGASKFLQDVREAPASITVITADDIRRHGHRTLADVLRSVRGVYTTYDRNYMYLGFRGMARPGDYNTRLLLLVDGHRLNDGIFHMAPVGTDFPIDLSLIDRVEVIRGPASSLYGTNAFLGVINVVTRTGSTRRGVQVEADGGTLDTSRVSASYGRLFGGGRELIVSASRYRSAGQSELSYPEFANTPERGIARGLDGDRSASLFGSYLAGHMSIRGALADRAKDVPTASYGTVFGDRRTATVDRRGYLDATYDGPLRGGWSGLVRLGYDYYHYAGRYPYDYGEGVIVQEDGADDRTLSAEVALRRRVSGSHLVTAGVDSRYQARSRQWVRDDVYGPQMDIDRPAHALGAFLQDEIQVNRRLLATVGVRADALAGRSRITPRVALVVLPRSGMSIKLLHGRAFRAPNAYESYYYADQAGRVMDVERMASSELVWEQTFARRVRATVSGFTYTVDGLIEQRSVNSENLNALYFANGSGMRGTGVELEVESRFDSGLVASASHTVTRVTDTASGERVSNSPGHLSKAGLQVPVRAFMLGVDGLYVGSRLTLAGEPLGGFFIPSVTLTSTRRRVNVQVGIYNVFDRQYADPGAEEHAQQAIGQDGRTALARVRFAF